MWKRQRKACLVTEAHAAERGVLEFYHFVAAEFCKGVQGVPKAAESRTPPKAELKQHAVAIGKTFLRP